MNRLSTATLTVLTLLVPTLLPVPMLAQDDGRKNVLLLRWRGERYILHRATGFPYIS
jgi:hypothetical protein